MSEYGDDCFKRLGELKVSKTIDRWRLNNNTSDIRISKTLDKYRYAMSIIIILYQNVAYIDFDYTTQYLLQK